MISTAIDRECVGRKKMGAYVPPAAGRYNVGLLPNAASLFSCAVQYLMI
jgi:hypothetical protein